MAIAEADWPVLLRALIYAGTVLAAGGVLFRVSFPRMQGAEKTLKRQVLLGAALIFICEPLRYLLFLQEIAGGDLRLALSPSMRWIGMETPFGQAAAIRLAAAMIILVVGLRARVVGVGAAVAIIGSYLLEGHTASSDWRPILAALLFIHLLAVHWWIGGLPSLFAAAKAGPRAQLAHTVRRFGINASWAVGALVIAGGTLLGVLSEWHFDLASAYQQAFALKLGAAVLILVIAAVNKWRLTPWLERDHSAGATALRRSLAIETAVAFVILAATALATAFPPAPN